LQQPITAIRKLHIAEWNSIVCVLNAPRLSVVRLAELIAEAHRHLMARQHEQRRGQAAFVN
jgi:hypothetical protein